MLDSRHWKTAEIAGSMPFQLDGDAVPTSRTSSRRAWISTAEGIVARASGPTMWIEGDAPISLRHSLPSVIEPCALLGRRVRVTVVHVALLDAGLTQTLTIAASDGTSAAAPRRGPQQELRPLLIAHVGQVRGITHTLGKQTVFVALSQRPGGPMVFGTARLQSLLRPGDHVRVRSDDDVYLMHFESRDASSASYVIVDESLWRGPPSTRRS